MGQSILFAALNVATGEGIARWKPQYRGQDFVAFLRDVNACVEAEREVHVALDNLSVHKAPAVHRWLLRHPRFQFHFTPTYASWMNLVGAILRIADPRRRLSEGPTRAAAAATARLAYVEAHNERRVPFKWVKTADEILDKMRRFGLRVQQVHGQ